jgi:transposase
LVQRAKLVLLASRGWKNIAISQALGLHRRSVGEWRRRFVRDGFAGIERELPRGGRRTTRRTRCEARIIVKTTQELPPNATHWSTRILAKTLGVSQSMVLRVWKANGLKPHLVKTFKVSNDPEFEEKLVDVVGLYLSPPPNALVLSADEKSQIQALDRTQPSLPFVPGRCGTLTHDYKRNGTTTLFAAIDTVMGYVVAQGMPRHRHQEWIRFLKKIDEETPGHLDLHVIVDNSATHKHPRVKAWLKRHPRFHMPFIPTSSSWLNVVERFFRDLTEKRLRRGVFHSVDDLINALMNYIEKHNEDPRPFVWTAAAKEIIEKVGRARLALDKVTSE